MIVFFFFQILSAELSATVCVSKFENANRNGYLINQSLCVFNHIVLKKSNYLIYSPLPLVLCSHYIKKKLLKNLIFYQKIWMYCLYKWFCTREPRNWMSRASSSRECVFDRPAVPSRPRTEDWVSSSVSAERVPASGTGSSPSQRHHVGDHEVGAPDGARVAGRRPRHAAGGRTRAAAGTAEGSPSCHRQGTCSVLGFSGSWTSGDLYVFMWWRWISSRIYDKVLFCLCRCYVMLYLRVLSRMFCVLKIVLF